MSTLAQGMSGLALIFSFALLCARRPGPALIWTAAQALTVSIAMAAERDWQAALLNAIASGLLVPFLLHRIGLPVAAGGRTALTGTLAAACGLSLLAAGAGALAVPLAVLLLGLLLLATRRSGAFQVFGLCSMQQAALLATGVSGTAPPMLPLLITVPALPALAALGLWFGTGLQSKRA